jgi:hypothetical protein
LHQSQSGNRAVFFGSSLAETSARAVPDSLDVAALQDFAQRTVYETGLLNALFRVGLALMAESVIEQSQGVEIVCLRQRHGPTFATRLATKLILVPLFGDLKILCECIQSFLCGWRSWCRSQNLMWMRFG